MMRLVDCLERVDIKWCAIGGVAVNHWAEEPMVTQDVDFVVSAEDIERSIDKLSSVGFKAERLKLFVNFSGMHSARFLCILISYGLIRRKKSM